ncbi:MAG: hypothetical protein IPI82_13175 [Candidatus Microthrix sp.]|nr:hypothetical protein [Candidatus Microthrix sp.]MBK7323355.1 hypothetical protein [Candidatus Microthrix sp.]
MTLYRLRHWRQLAVFIVTVLAAVAFIGFIALHVPGMGLDEGATSPTLKGCSKATWHPTMI